MINRYANRTIFNNKNDLYYNLLNKRLVKNINHYETPKYIIDFNSISKYTTVHKHIWTLGDRYYKLASLHYGDPKDWWILALYNSKPTESNINLGDIIYIPKPLSTVLNYIKY